MKTHQQCCDLLNQFLRANGVQVGETFKGGDIQESIIGCHWDDCDRAWHVTLPKSFDRLIQKVKVILWDANLHVADWRHLGVDGLRYVHIIASV